jgi:hypothetical protein
MHLLPGLGQLNGIDPLVVPRIADIIKMIVHPGVSNPLTFRRNGQPLDVARVVVTPKNRDVVGYLHATLVVATDFFVYAPHLRDSR